MPRVPLLTFTLIAAMISPACEQQRLPEARREQFVRVLFIGHAQDEPTWPVIQTEARRFAEKYANTAVEVEAPRTRSPRGQQELLRAAGRRGVQVICIMPSDPGAIRSIVGELSVSGIPIVAVGQDIQGAQCDAYCGPSDMEIGRSAARACGQILQERSKKVMLLHAGEDDPIHGMRLRGFRAEAPLWGPVEILRDINCGGDPREARRMARAEAKRYPRIGCWVLLDDWPLRGLPEKEHLFSLGVTMVLCEDSPKNWPRLRDGQIQAVIGYDIQAAIEESLFRAVRLARGDVSNTVRDIFIPPEIITDKSLPGWEERWHAWRAGLPTTRSN